MVLSLEIVSTLQLTNKTLWKLTFAELTTHGLVSADLTNDQFSTLALFCAYGPRRFVLSKSAKRSRDSRSYCKNWRIDFVSCFTALIVGAMTSPCLCAMASQSTEAKNSCALTSSESFSAPRRF